ncbi:putative oxidoreductase [Streptomyces lydicamycinicus]|uniref:Putative oxidoreductase n=1 Tax=Streptomyces lydicamycinicus TaxID=1546107 RepID=A0A0P4RFI8_9ACTN|nr:putative oxidoreductase [Streptomyces lydicamycinicus]
MDPRLGALCDGTPVECPRMADCGGWGGRGAPGPWAELPAWRSLRAAVLIKAGRRADVAGTVT